MIPFRSVRSFKKILAIDDVQFTSFLGCLLCPSGDKTWLMELCLVLRAIDSQEKAGKFNCSYPIAYSQQEKKKKIIPVNQ